MAQAEYSLTTELTLGYPVSSKVLEQLGLKPQVVAHAEVMPIDDPGLFGIHVDENYGMAQKRLVVVATRELLDVFESAFTDNNLSHRDVINYIGAITVASYANKGLFDEELITGFRFVDAEAVGVAVFDQRIVQARTALQRIESIVPVIRTMFDVSLDI